MRVRILLELHAGDCQVRAQQTASMLVDNTHQLNCHLSLWCEQKPLKLLWVLELVECLYRKKKYGNGGFHYVDYLIVVLHTEPVSRAP